MTRREAIAAREANVRGRPMPIKTARLEFDGDGYPEWYAVVRLNVRGYVMDDYRSGEKDRWWRAIGQIVQEWNFCDEDGEPLPLPSETTVNAEGETAARLSSLDLPENLLSALLRRFREAYNEHSQPPKESSENSTTTSTTTP